VGAREISQSVFESLSDRGAVLLTSRAAKPAYIPAVAGEVPGDSTVTGSGTSATTGKAGDETKRENTAKGEDGVVIVGLHWVDLEKPC